MFKNIKKINNLLAEIKNIIVNINTVDESIDNIKNEITSNTDNYREQLSTYITDTTNKINSLKIINNERNNFANSNFFVNFSDESFLEENNGMNIDTEQNFLCVEKSAINNLSNYTFTYNEKNNLITVSFDEIVEINNIFFSFFDLNEDPIAPIQIFFNENEYDNLYEVWMDTVSKTDITNTFINRYYFETRFVKQIHFKFSDKILDRKTLFNFNKLEYNESGEIIYSFPFANQVGFNFNKQDYTELVGVNYSYSLDNAHYTPIKTTDDLYNKLDFSSVLFDTVTPQNTNLFIKIERGSLSRILQNNKEIVTSDVVVEGRNLKRSFVNYSLKEFSIGEDDRVDIIVSSAAYDLYKDIMPDLFQITSNHLVKIKDSFIHKTDAISNVTLLSLKNQNSINSFKNFTPVIYRNSDNEFFLPKVLADLDLNFLYQKQEEKDILDETDYTPLVFNFSLDFVGDSND